MLNRRYPIGQPTSTSHYRHDKIGFYRCIVKKQPERNIIPKREETLNWTYRGEINAMLTSVDIECLWKHGGVVEIIAGYYWEEDQDDIFSEFFSPIIDEKYRQDEWKGTERYNAALRETCKLLMNSLSGKLQQRLFETLIELIRGNDDLQSFRKKTKNSTETFTSIGKWYIARGERLNVRPKMPTIWGSLILAYARSYMYDEILSRIQHIYGMDTDSAFIHREDIPRPLLGSKLGQFKEEIVDAMDNEDKGPFGSADQDAF
ncbi:hypothetical protein G6F27_013219 [Rhizopus arrhizus]|nr:hypothetical protein G6F27_013219 [Rhizopus arrhizus]